MKRNDLLYFILAICLFTTIACNNDGRSAYSDDTTDADRAMTSFAEQNFVAEAAEVTAEGIAWAREAARMGTDEALRSQAQRMLPDLERLNSNMKSYADKWNLRVDDIDTAVTLDERKGTEWDEEWADELGDAHRRLIRRFERAENRVEDEQLRDLISQSLPLLRAHRDSLEKLETRFDDRSMAIK